MPNSKKIIVIGAGAAGLMAAGTAQRSGATVCLFDGNTRPGRKLLITGKGRCNLTNNCTVPEFLENVPQNPRFLYAALSAFPPSATMELAESLGVPLKTERGRRVFPVSDKAVDVVDAFVSYAKGATYISEKVTDIVTSEGKAVGIRTAAGNEYFADALILATGGRSYPLTGSDGSGYRLAEKVGHTVTEIKPSLVPIVCDSPVCRELQGLSLRNISFEIRDKKSGRIIFQDFGEMMFAHFGITGPVVLSASSHLHGYAINTLEAVIDLKPALDIKTLDARLLSDFEKYKNRDVVNAMTDLLPHKMISPVLRFSGIDERKKINALTRDERRALLDTLKGFTIPLRAFRPIDEAIVTSGGISVKEVNPKTMESKIIRNLYFAGEILDVDAYTGGYNLQIAFSTGYAAATHAVLSGKEEI